jgi:ElaB/YqjD/DUF883 family membrane-anchored ribosome-binding protein
MFPNLFHATQEYWYKLDQIEKAYYQNELTLEEVNAEVEKLMQELGQQRKDAYSFFRQQFSHFLTQYKEFVLGVAFAVLAIYFWQFSN